MIIQELGLDQWIPRPVIVGSQVTDWALYYKEFLWILHVSKSCILLTRIHSKRNILWYEGEWHTLQKVGEDKVVLLQGKPVLIQAEGGVLPKSLVKLLDRDEEFFFSKLLTG